MSDVEIIGLISKLETTFAFATTERGNVYIPISAARTPNETLVSLKDKFGYNETVKLVVTKQTSRKNDCNWQAKSVRKVEGSSPKRALSDEIFGPLIANVSSTTDSYAFAHHTEWGSIFIPGEAFDKQIVKSVNGYISTKNQVIVRFKEQIERKGCKWVAIEAVKHYEPQNEEDFVAIEEKRMLISVGMVLVIDKMEIEVLDEKNECIVHCPIIAHTGGIQDNLEARNLEELMKNQSHVMFKAVKTGEKWVAFDWKPVKNIEELVVPTVKKTSDTYVQTPVDIMTVILRKLLDRHPEDLAHYTEVLKCLPDSALPDVYIMARDKDKYVNKKWE